METPVAEPSAVSGRVTVAVIAVRPHAGFLLGTHAEFRPRGEFARLRVAVQNDLSTFQSFTWADMVLVTGDGVAHTPDWQAMVIKRQQEETTISAQGRLEFDVWYDVPRGSTLRTFRLTNLDPVAEVPLPPT
jgi:hypothetical protein